MTENLNSTSWKSVDDFLKSDDGAAVSCFREARWDHICLVASNANHNLECTALDQVASGLHNVVRLLEFSDKGRWAARINVKASAALQTGSAELEAEIATMQLIKERSELPVPRVFAYALDGKNPARVAYMLIEVLPGIVAMDALGGYEVHHGVIPTEHRRHFYESVAKCHKTSIRLAQIGSIVRNRDGSYGSGPLPGIGGPFNTAAEFFEAWADNVKFKWDDETIRRMMQRGPIPADEMIAIIHQFPSRIKSIASRLSASNNGPFPLCHDDFLHSNIMIDENSFDVTGVIDWEGACTVPWELIAFPEFLVAMPKSFDFPEKYDSEGQPIDEELRETWCERRDYIDMVKSAELEDNLLSTCLSSSKCQTLAYAYGAYSSIGKLGFYDGVIDEVQK